MENKYDLKEYTFNTCKLFYAQVILFASYIQLGYINSASTEQMKEKANNREYSQQILAKNT